MAKEIILKCQHISEIDFAPFGQVLHPDTVEEKLYPNGDPITEGGITVTPGVGKVDFPVGDSVVFSTLFAPQRGYKQVALERHVKSSQSFIPLNGGVGIFLLCPPNDPTPGTLPELDKAVALIFDGTEGLNLKAGTWHSTPHPLSETALYVLVNRAGTQNDDLTVIDLVKEMDSYFNLVL